MKPGLKPAFPPVPLPGTNVSINRINGVPYVYHIGKGFRNAQGKPTSKKTSIGRLDETSGMLIPNDNYFVIYGMDTTKARQEEIAVDQILNFGDFFLLDCLARRLNLDFLLRNVFGEIGADILLMAIFMTLDSSALYHCETWCEETLTGRHKAISSQQCGRILNLIDEKSRMDFFTAWAYAKEQQEYLAYDVTSISSYSKGNEAVEFGYNRDHEDLPQINLGMYFGESSRLPIYYCTYPGSINDTSHLCHMMANNERLGIADCRFVMDRGFFSEENIKYMAKKGFMFILAMMNHHKIPLNLINKYGIPLKSSRYDLGSSGVQGIVVENTDYGFRCNIHLFYDDEKKADEERALRYKLAKFEEALNKGDNPKGAELYFVITEGNDSVRQIERNYDYIDSLRQRFGYFLIMTTDFAKTPADVLRIYRMKDVVEKSFDNLKNHLDMRRLRVHSAAAYEGKMFVAFVGLILRASVQNTLAEFLDKHRRMSLETVFRELKKLKVIKTRNGLLLHNPITKKQRDILAAFGQSEEDIRAWLDAFSST